MKKSRKEEPNNVGDVISHDLKGAKFKGNSRRRSGSNKSKGKTKFEDASDFRRMANDPQWYFKDKSTLNAVASFSYSTPIGSDLLPTEVYDLTDLDVMSSMNCTIPGLMAIRVGLTPGIASNAQDPLNLAAQNVYSFVRYKNSGAKNYDTPDLMLYLLAMDSIYSCWTWLKRIYGYTSTYSQLNKYKPMAYAAADHVDLSDIYAHLADFRAYINMTADRISAFCVPATMTYMVRHSWLFTNIFTDQDIKKPQEYIYVPAWFYQYDEMSSSKGGQLIPLDVCYDYASKPLYTFASLRILMDSLIEAVMYAEDIGIMSGDILKAYEQSGLFKLSGIDADYKIDSMYDRRALSQIENANTWFCRWSLSNAKIENSGIPLKVFSITQDPDTNFLKFRPTYTTTNTASYPYRNCPIGAYLNFHWDDPSPEDVIEATRLMWSGEVAGDGQTWTLTSVGSEMVTDIKMYVFCQQTEFLQPYVRNAPLKLQEVPFTTDEKYSGSTVAWTPVPAVGIGLTDPEWVARLQALMTTIWTWMAFDWAPMLRLGVGIKGVTIDPNYPDAITLDLPYFREWANYTTLGNPNITAINTLAILSEFNVPN